MTSQWGEDYRGHQAFGKMKGGYLCSVDGVRIRSDGYVFIGYHNQDGMMTKPCIICTESGLEIIE